jgi:hypothetical protein
MFRLQSGIVKTSSAILVSVPTDVSGDKPASENRNSRIEYRIVLANDCLTGTPLTTNQFPQAA